MPGPGLPADRSGAARVCATLAPMSWTPLLDIPEMRSLVLRTDDHGLEWVSLQAYYNWDEHLTDERDL